MSVPYSGQFVVPKQLSEESEGSDYGDQEDETRLLHTDQELVLGEAGRQIYDVKKHADSHQLLQATLLPQRHSGAIVFNDIELRKACSNEQKGRNTLKNIIKRLHYTSAEYNIYPSKYSCRLCVRSPFVKCYLGLPLHPNLGKVSQ